MRIGNLNAYYPGNLAYAVIIAHLNWQIFIHEIRQPEKDVKIEPKNRRIYTFEQKTYGEVSLRNYRPGMFLDLKV